MVALITFDGSYKMQKIVLNSFFILLVTLLSRPMFGGEKDLCVIAQHPWRFSGQMISFRATVWHGIEHHGMKTDNCDVLLDWRTPEKAPIKVPFKLKRNEDWEQFSKYSSMNSPIHTLPEVDPHFAVTATFRGLFFYKKQNGFLKLLLIIESVSNIKVEPD